MALSICFLRSESSTEADSFLSVVSTPSPRVLNLIYHHIRAKSSAVCEQFMKILIPFLVPFALKQGCSRHKAGFSATFENPVLALFTYLHALSRENVVLVMYCAVCLSSHFLLRCGTESANINDILRFCHLFSSQLLICVSIYVQNLSGCSMPHYCLQFFQAHLVQIFRAERVSESVRENVRDLIIRVLLVILLLSSRHFRRNVLAYHRFSILCKEQKTAISTYTGSSIGALRFSSRCLKQ